MVPVNDAASPTSPVALSGALVQVVNLTCRAVCTSASRPAKSAPLPAVASISSRRFHLAVRSDHVVRLLFIWPDRQPTARSAGQESSVSPERADTIVVCRQIGLPVAPSQLC